MKQRQAWQQQLIDSKTTISQVSQLLALRPEDLGASTEAEKSFPLRVTPHYLNKIRKGDAQDPLLLQILPQTAETLSVLGYGIDPLQEKEFNPVPGLLHKYRSRVLLVTTGTCAIHCRYCFRRNFPYQDNQASQQDWKLPLQYIAEHPEIDEVILSGGDPLTLNDKLLGHLMTAIAEIPHIKRLRFHSRIPVILPERITPEFIQLFANTRLQVIMVVHANHPQEIDVSTRVMAQALRQANIHLLNQTVLLKNINDSAETLAHLSNALFDCGIQPYYLHLLDKVAGSAHFDIPLEQAKEIYLALQSLVSGYLVPKLVYEEPRAQSKKMV
jgi:EF-P beta-lysylation protein EpmB